jgi:hypothetical protein
MLNAGRLARVEVLPATYRVRREEVEQIAFGQKPEIRKVDSGNVELRQLTPVLSPNEAERVKDSATLKT